MLRIWGWPFGYFSEMYYWLLQFLSCTQLMKFFFQSISHIWTSDFFSSSGRFTFKKIFFSSKWFVVLFLFSCFLVICSKEEVKQGWSCSIQSDPSFFPISFSIYLREEGFSRWAHQFQNNQWTTNQSIKSYMMAVNHNYGKYIMNMKMQANYQID